MTQQTCRIAFRWEGNGEPLPMECTVQLQGAVDTPKLTLMLPIDNPTNESTNSSKFYCTLKFCILNDIMLLFVSNYII